MIHVNAYLVLYTGRPRGAVGSGPAAVLQGLFLRLLSRPRFRPSRARAGVSLGLDGCEVVKLVCV